LWARRFVSCRASPRELRALRVSDVDYPADTTIRVELGWDDEGGPIEPKSRKGRRVVPVASELRRYLLTHKLATGRDDDELLFGRTRRSRSRRRTSASRRARRALSAVGTFLRGESADLEPIALHECRHTYVSLMFAAGCSLEEIGDYVGHSSTYMTDRHRHRGCENRGVRETQLEDFGSGLTPVTQGWFVVNVRDAEWWFAETRGARCAFENEYGEPPVEFAQLGINVTVLDPGQTTLYHAEANQEAFLVVTGECALIVEEEERRLRPWDFFHAPPWTEHAFVGAGDGPCVILMVGARSGPGVQYPASELAARHGASVAEETSDWREAYATVERFRRERPPNWARLPWA
jgi:uncharacterized cupin superfamily protein